MTNDPLKALLIAADAPSPDRDLNFVIEVMERVERRRFLSALALWLLGGSFVTILMSLIMPYMTPALVAFGQEIVPAVAMITLAIAVTAAWVNRWPWRSRIGV